MSDEDRVKWDRLWREQRMLTDEPNPFLVGLLDRLPRSGRALDVAGGAGRHAVCLAGHGLDVTLVDVSPVGLSAASDAASRAGVGLTTRLLDLEREPLPTGPWQVIANLHYLDRSLFDVYPSLLGPGGLLVFAHPTRTNLERNPRPGAHFLLEDGELPTLVRGLEILHSAEGWTGWGRHEAHLLARRPGSMPG